MGISKLTCTLKGEVPPKWLLDEDVPVCYRQALKDVGKILHHFIPLSRESLLKQQINRIFLLCHFYFLPPWRVSWACERIFLKRDKLETQLSILRPRRGHALKKKRSRAACSDTTDPDYFRHEMRAEI
jgi:hypothetical protein